MDADRNVGSRVAGYSIESVLGRGGMGVVYLARQRSPDRRVALKLIAPGFADDETFRRRFLRESAAAAAIDHPHILPIYESGESEGVLFIAMRLVDGDDLRTILRASAPLDPERVVALVGQVGSALDAAHARGLVHRDVKPGNILVARESGADDADFCYLTDFGVSTWTTSSAATISSTGSMVGSVNYAAPEQIEGTRVDGRADGYSLGCVLYECLTGHAPFAGRSPPGVLYAHLHEEPPTPSSLRPELPSAVDAVVGRALRKDPEERYPSCRDLTLDLRSALTGKAAGSATTVPAQGSKRALRFEPRRRAGTARIVAAAVVVALAVAVVGLTVVRQSGRDGAPTTGTGSGSSPDGRGSPERIRDGVQVIASHTAPSSKDAAGNTIAYLPGNVIDGNVETAWRVEGNGHGETITLLFDSPIDIVEIGLIPGYAKFDPQTGEDRFTEERVITEVRYLIPGLPPTVQQLRPKPLPQLVTLSATTSRVTVEIVDTTEPGGKNFTAISEIYVYGYPQ